MSKQHDRDWEDCPLCGGAGEVSISKDGTYEGTDYYGCPMCISRERDEEARLIETQRDEQLAVNAVLEMAARQLLEAVEDFEGYRQDIDTAIADLREALDYPKQDLGPAACNGWVPREVLFDNGEPVGHREPQPAAVGPEPVAHLYCGGQFGGELDEWEIDPEQYQCDRLNERFGALGKQARIPLYTAPQPARQPLTEDRLVRIVRKLGWGQSDFDVHEVVELARAIERWHGIVGEV